jgi:hypothetical protein
MGFLTSLAAGLYGLICVDNRTRGGEWRGAVSLGIALASSGLGLMMWVAVLVELLIARRSGALLRTALPPGVLYGLWYVTKGTSEGSVAHLSLVPGYVWRAAQAAVGSVFGLDEGLLTRLLVLLLAALILGVVHRGGLTPRLAASLCGLLFFWVLTALARGSLGDPAASRYLYPGALLVILIVGEVWGAYADVLPARRALGVGAVVVLGLAAWSNLSVLRDAAAGLRDVSGFVRAELAAVEIAGELTPPDFRPDVDRMPQVSASRYLQAVSALGSPADSAAELRRRRPLLQNAADVVLTEILVARGDLRAAADSRSLRCTSLERTEHADMPLPPRGLSLHSPDSPVVVRLRRFGTTYPQASGLNLEARRVAEVRVPPSLSSPDWHVSAQTTGTIVSCQR